MNKFKSWLLEEGDKEDFIGHHNTGWIRSDAYERYEADGGLSWLGNKEKYPILLGTKKYGQYQIEFRQRGTKLSYTKTDTNGQIVRDESGFAMTMTPEEMRAEGLRETDATIVAFHGEKPIALASNEWGTLGTWVEKSYQRMGIGTDLMMMFMEDNPAFLQGKSKLGQMTNAGHNAALKLYDKIANKYGQDWFQRRDSLVPKKP